MVAGTAIFASWTHSFSRSLGLASLIFALGFLYFELRQSPMPPLTWRLKWSGSLVLIMAVGLILTTMVSLLALKFSFHDQMRIQAHPPLIESLLRGNFPPNLMAFPNIPLKYHWGADLFGAIVSYITGLPAYRSIDVTMIFGWVALYGALYVFCREIGMNRPYTLLALLWVLLAAGWAYLLKPYLASPESLLQLNYDWPDSKRIFGRHLNPGNISNFFMTPSSLGMPVFFAYLSLLVAWTRRHGYPMLTLLAALLGALSLIQVAYFVTSLSSTLAIMVVQPYFEKISWRQTFGEILLFVTLSLGIAVLLGGFFTQDAGYDPRNLLFNWPPGYLRNATWGSHIPIHVGQAFLWYLSTFGSMLFLTIPAMSGACYLLKKSYRPWMLFLLVYALQCFVVAQFVRYKYSWDIIKWFTGFHVTIVLLVISVVALWPRKIQTLTTALWLLMILDTFPSWRFLGSLAFLQPEQVKSSQRDWWNVVIPKPSAEMQSIIQLLKKGPWNDSVLATNKLSPWISDYSGQAMSALDLNTIYFGIEPRLIQERKAQIAILQKDFNIDVMKTMGTQWLVFSCPDFKNFFSLTSQQAIEQALTEGKLLDKSFEIKEGCWRVFRRD